MGVMPDHWIRKMALEQGMIEPFAEGQARQGVISYGVTSYGYDMRVGEEFKVFSGRSAGVVDAKRFEAHWMTEYRGEVCVIPPNSFVLGRSVEYFRIPRDVLAICTGKSTYARCGIIVNVTPLEPEWEGYVTLEISNTGPRPARIYANEGIAQVIFLLAQQVCERSYADKKGKYQQQTTITPAKL